MAEEAGTYNYNKRPMWQWLLVYVVIGGIIYSFIYYFFMAKKGNSVYNYGSYVTPTTTQEMSPTSSTQVAQNTVVISNFKYAPVSLTIKVGEKVTWTNQDSMSHSATADDKSFDTGLLEKGKSGSVTFSKAGTYTYHCSLHPNMHGTVIVQ